MHRRLDLAASAGATFGLPSLVRAQAAEWLGRSVTLLIATGSEPLEMRTAETDGFVRAEYER